MSKPIIAIVGRPNVGKSTLFNRLIDQRLAIVSDTAGTTRDRLYADTDFAGREFTVVDTGGFELNDRVDLPGTPASMLASVRGQAQAAIEEGRPAGDRRRDGNRLRIVEGRERSGADPAKRGRVAARRPRIRRHRQLARVAGRVRVRDDDLVVDAIERRIEARVPGKRLA
jgi:hypothetical protein